MISIEEMREYKKREDKKATDEWTAHCNKIRGLEDKIRLGLSAEIKELVEYSRVAMECGLISEDDCNDPTKYIPEDETIIAEGFYHELGLIRTFGRPTTIVGVGIKNGGYNGCHDLLVMENGEIVWKYNGESYMTEMTFADKCKDEHYEYCLTKFIRDFNKLKSKVYALVEKRVRVETEK